MFPLYPLSARDSAAFAAASADECCGASATAPLAEYASVWTFEGGNCSLYYGTRHGGGPRVEPRAGAVSGWSVFPFNESDVVDLIDYSCLNGWTMGNIAFSPADAVRFWHALLVDRSPLGADGVAALPAGTHRAFRKARGAFLRTYLDLLIARFAARRRGISEEGGGTPNDTNDANETVPPRVAAAGAALRVEPLMLQFSVGAFGDLMAEDEAFAAAEADEETREARRARSAEANGETND